MYTDWVIAEVPPKGILDIIVNLWLESQPLIVDLISLVQHNAKERWAHMNWASEYYMLPMHLLHHLYIELNTWCISVTTERQREGSIDTM